jgi:hypothetical protein
MVKDVRVDAALFAVATGVLLGAGKLLYFTFASA